MDTNTSRALGWTQMKKRETPQLAWTEKENVLLLFLQVSQLNTCTNIVLFLFPQVRQINACISIVLLVSTG
jgi:hypothetical protein